jgi:hypothetical protein
LGLLLGASLVFGFDVESSLLIGARVESSFETGEPVESSFEPGRGFDFVLVGRSFFTIAGFGFDVGVGAGAGAGAGSGASFVFGFVVRPLNFVGLLFKLGWLQFPLFPPTLFFNQSLPLFTGFFTILLVTLFTLFAMSSKILPHGAGGLEESPLELGGLLLKFLTPLGGRVPFPKGFVLLDFVPFVLVLVLVFVVGVGLVTRLGLVFFLEIVVLLAGLAARGLTSLLILVLE